MKTLNTNKAKLLLLFTRDPRINSLHQELEYYSSDNDMQIGLILKDKVDETFHALLFDRNSRKKYCIVDWEIDLHTIQEARKVLEQKMNSYVRNDKILNENKPANDFFALKVKPEQQHPYFKMLIDKKGFFTAAKEVIEELSFHFEDRDGNFVEQFQSNNGFEARLWELYLWCYFREEGFNFCNQYAAPDFLINKGAEEVAIEAVHISRKQSLNELTTFPTQEEILYKLENEIPLMYGSSLYSKLKHTYENKKYWELPQVKDKPLIYAIADFHADMSMTWSFPGIISILYGIIQRQPVHNEDGTISIQNESGIVFQKNNINIKPLFLDDQFKHVSAVLFSPCGTLAKFNRMGVQAGLGNGTDKLYQIKMCYNSTPNAIYPDVIGAVVNEQSCETWSDGIQIYHNPFAEIKLNPNLFPHAGHNFYDGQFVRSLIPDNHIISTTTHNIKNMPINPPSFKMHSSDIFDKIEQKWRL